jgi:hypothetical protein
MNNKLTSLTVPAMIAGALVFGLVGCGNDGESFDDFEQRCEDANGQVQRDSETLGMDAVAFVSGRGGGGSKGSSRSSSSGGSLGGLFGGSDKQPKNKSPKLSKDSNKLPKGKNTKKPGKSTKSHSDGDDEWVCAKDGVELFEQE